MKVAVYSAKEYEKPYLLTANQQRHDLFFIADTITADNTNLAAGCAAICCFVTDILDKSVLSKLAEQGVKLIALRSAGYDNVDVPAAQDLGLVVTRVPQYSPQAVAEFAVALILTLSRRILASQTKSLQHDFSLDGLLGFNLYQKTVGVIGAGKIGTAFAKIMHGFGCKLLACDPFPNHACQELGVQYVSLEHLLAESDIISLHCLLNEQTRHLLGAQAFAQLKKGAMLINTGRGALLDTAALLDALANGTVGYAGLDVYEKEAGLFFVDHHSESIKDKQFLQLQAQPNVLVTGHHAFFTVEAMENIALTTIENISAMEQGAATNQIF